MINNGRKGVVLLWNSETTKLDEQSPSNQRVLERLEAENAELRESVADLVLQIQTLRDGATAPTVKAARFALRCGHVH
jgi:cell division protein FtsB